MNGKHDFITCEYEGIHEGRITIKVDYDKKSQLFSVKFIPHLYDKLYGGSTEKEYRKVLLITEVKHVILLIKCNDALELIDQTTSTTDEMFYLIEQMIYVIRLGIQQFIPTLKLIAVSDSHGDFFTFIFPYVFSRLIFNIKTSSFNLNMNHVIHINCGDYYPRTPNNIKIDEIEQTIRGTNNKTLSYLQYEFKERFMKLYYENLCPIIEYYIHELNGKNSYFLLGNHDDRLIDKENLYSRIIYSTDKVSYSFIHGIPNDLFPYEANYEKNGNLYLFKHNRSTDIYDYRSNDIIMWKNLENNVIKLYDVISHEINSEFYVSVFGHVFKYELYGFLVNKFDRNEHIIRQWMETGRNQQQNSLLNNIISLDASNNSSVNSLANVWHTKTKEIKMKLNKDGYVEFNFPYIKKSIKLTRSISGGYSKSDNHCGLWIFIAFIVVCAVIIVSLQISNSESNNSFINDSFKYMF